MKEFGDLNNFEQLLIEGVLPAGEAREVWNFLSQPKGFDRLKCVDAIANKLHSWFLERQREGAFDRAIFEGVASYVDWQEVARHHLKLIQEESGRAGDC